MEDAADSKSAEVYPSWGFESPLRHQVELRTIENSQDSVEVASDGSQNPPVAIPLGFESPGRLPTDDSRTVDFAEGLVQSIESPNTPHFPVA